MNHQPTRMEEELRQTPDAVRRQASGLADPLAQLVARLKDKPPLIAVTCARGSSAHAATFGKYLIERYFGIPVAAAAPSIASVYGQHLRLKDQLFLAISQSGRSDDLVAQAKSARASGALTAALVNDADSPLASSCEIVLPMDAGEELSVAATKTFVASLTALLRLTSAWANDAALDAAIGRLPERLDAATDLTWDAPAGVLAASKSLATIGRGPTLSIAREAALKLKETCHLHAEAFSGAEFMHGPVALVSQSFPVLLFMTGDATAAGLRRLAADLRRKGTALFVAEPGASDPARLPALPPDHPDADAVCLIQSFYAMIVPLARRLGTDVDRPRNLEKVTRTT